MVYKLIIAGSRDIDDYELLKENIIKSGLWGKYKRNLVVVCGMARGADMLGHLFAKRNHLEIIEMPADWDTYGKRAGYMRNADMANIADACLILWNGVSKGSKHMYDLALSKGLYLYQWNTLTEETDIKGELK